MATAPSMSGEGVFTKFPVLAGSRVSILTAFRLKNMLKFFGLTIQSVATEY